MFCCKAPLAGGGGAPPAPSSLRLRAGECSRLRAVGGGAHRRRKSRELCPYAQTGAASVLEKITFVASFCGNPKGRDTGSFVICHTGLPRVGRPAGREAQQTPSP